MNLKTSFFNKSIYRSDMKRLWWISAIEAIFIFLSWPFPIMEYISKNPAGYPPSTAFNNSIIMSYTYVPVFFATVIPAALAIFLFSYLNSSKAAATMHGLPIKRSTFFLTHLLSGLTLFTLPVIVNSAILLIYHAASTAAVTFRLLHLLMFTVMCLVYSLIAFSGTAAVTMLTGNNVAALVLTGVIAAVPAVTEEFVYYFLNQQLYGYCGNASMNISDFLYVPPRTFWSGPWNIVKYLVFSVLLLAAAMWLYRIRKIENNNEVLAFPKLRPVFVYCAALYIGGFGYIYLGEMWSLTNIFLFIPLGVVGIVAAEMLMKKSLRVKSAIKPAVIFCAAICLVWLGFKVDISGFEKRVPSVNSVKSVELTNNAISTNSARRYFSSDGDELTFNGNSYAAVLTDEDDIKNMIELHKDLTKHRDYEADDYFQITYNLANGKKMTRAYHVNMTEQKALLEPIIESEPVRKAYLPILKDIKRNIISVEINDVRAKDAMIFYPADTDTINKIIGALKMDAQNSTYDSYARRANELTEIKIQFERPDAVYTKSGKPVPADKVPLIVENYQVHKDYKNTSALLTELGFFDTLSTAEDVECIWLDFYKYDASAESEYDGGTKNIEEPEQIAEIFNSLNTLYSGRIGNNYDAEMHIEYKSGKSIYLQYNTKWDNIPDILKR